MTTQKKQFDSPLPAWLASSPPAGLASHVYSAVINSRNLCYDAIPALSRKLKRPTISVGGIRAGGTGKTPVSLLIGQYVMWERGYAAAFLSRGYGRISKNNLILPPNRPVTWEEAGDEPCLLRANLPEAWLGIGANRTAVAEAMITQLPEKSAFILDDGFQRRQIRRDLDIVCVSEKLFDDRMIPSGYLRESLQSLKRADVILIVGAQERLKELRTAKAAVDWYLGIDGAASDEASDEASANGGRQVSAILLQYPRSWVEAATGKEVIPPETPPLKGPYAVSGIARPQRFIDMIRGMGIEPAEVKIFGDHHKYKNDDFEFARDVYYRGMLTTEKDFMRLTQKKVANAVGLWYLKIGLRFADERGEALVKSKINNIIL